MNGEGRSWRGCAVPPELYYDLGADVWVRPQAGRFTVGMTDVAQTRCGRLVQVSWKAPGSRIRRGRPLCVVESAKWVGPVRSPLSGTIMANNAEPLAADPALPNRDPYGAGWLVQLDAPSWDDERMHLSLGDDAWVHYRRLIDDEEIQCFRCAE